MSISISVRAISAGFAAEIGGVDLRQDVAEPTVRAIEAALDQYAVVVLRGQNITDEQQIAFSAKLGPLETTIHRIRPGAELRLDARIADVSNLNEKAEVLAANDRRRMNGLGNRLWHTDSSFKATPAKYSLLSARTIPGAGGETQFADLRAAYDALSDDMKQRLQNLVAEHCIMWSRATIGFTDYSEEERAALPPVPQRLVRFHPGSKRKTLYLASHARAIQGMPLPEALVLLLDLMEHATQREFVYTHTWRLGDLVIWDNRCTMHRARPYDLSVPRDMHRTTVADVAPTLQQAMVA